MSSSPPFNEEDETYNYITYDYCTDPNANLGNNNDELSLRDLFHPCRDQLALTVPLFVMTQLILLVVFTFLRKCCLRRDGHTQCCGCFGDSMDEDDIKSILSSRRNPYNTYPPSDEEQKAVVAEKADDDNNNNDGVKDQQPQEQAAVNATDAAEIMDVESAAAAGIIIINNNSSNDRDQPISHLPPRPPKDESTGIQRFNLHYLKSKYGDKKLRYTDSIPRKSLHFTSGLCLALQLQLITQTFVLNFQSALLGGICITILLGICNIPRLADTWVATHVYGGLNRTRDGIYGRTNLFVAYTGTTFGILISYMLAYLYVLPHLPTKQDDDTTTTEEESSSPTTLPLLLPDYQMLIGLLYYAPLAVGDALGELIGGPFGGTCFPTFRVKGFGEINKKSVEGCFAVFVGSFGSTALVSYGYGVMTNDATATSWIVLCLCLGITTTIVETIAFRSTDNFFIPVCNVIVLIVAFGTSSIRDTLLAF